MKNLVFVLGLVVVSSMAQGNNSPKGQCKSSVALNTMNLDGSPLSIPAESVYVGDGSQLSSNHLFVLGVMTLNGGMSSMVKLAAVPTSKPNEFNFIAGYDNDQSFPFKATCDNILK
jgi:hypothetical protein